MCLDRIELVPLSERKIWLQPARISPIKLPQTLGRSNASGVRAPHKGRYLYPLKRPYYSSIAAQVQVARDNTRGGENLKLEQSHHEVVILPSVICHNGSALLATLECLILF